MNKKNKQKEKMKNPFPKLLRKLGKNIGGKKKSSTLFSAPKNFIIRALARTVNLFSPRFTQIIKRLSSRRKLMASRLIVRGSTANRELKNDRWQITSEKPTIRTILSDFFYKLHLRIRYPHDIAFEKVKWYRRVAEKDKRGIKRGTVLAFTISLAVFVLIQTVFPGAYTPNKAEASAANKTWTTTADFQSATTNSQVNTIGDNLTLAASTMPANTVDNGNGTWTTTIYADTSDGTLSHCATYGDYLYPIDGVNNVVTVGALDGEVCYQRVFEKFNLSAITGSVNSAIFNMYVNSRIDYDPQMDAIVDSINDFGTLGTEDFDISAYQSNIGTIVTPSTPAPSLVSLAVTSAVQNDKANSRNSSFRLRSTFVPNYGDEKYIYLASADSATNKPYLAVTWTPSFLTPGTLGGTAAGNVGLRHDAQSIVKWTSVSANYGTLAANQAVKFRIRATNDTNNDGNVQSEFDTTSWYGPSGIVADMSNWTSNYFGSSTIAGNTNPANNNIPDSVALSRYAELMVRLESPTAGTPVLDDVTLNFDSLEAPTNGNITTYHSDGTTLLKTSSGADVTAGNGAGYTNEQTLVIKATGLTCGTTGGGNLCTGTSTGRKPEVEIKPVGTGFATNPISGTDTIVGTSTASTGELQSGEVTIPSSALTIIGGNGYHFRVRTVDDQGRISGWTNYASDATAFTVDRITTTLGSISINSGASYVNSISVNVTVTSAADADSKLNKLYLSNNGTDWTDATPGSGFTGQATYTGTISWTLASGDGQKTVYGKVADNAGNITGNVSSQSDWDNGVRGTDVSKSTGNIYLLKAIGMAASNASECASGALSGGVCVDNPWISGVNGIQVYYQDSTYTDGWSAPGSCSTVSGRLPTISELQAIYDNKASGAFGSFQLSPYWSSETSGISRYAVNMTNRGSSLYNSSSFNFYVRCVRASGAETLGGSGIAGTFISPVKDLGNNLGFNALSWNTPTSPSTITMRVRGGDDSTPDDGSGNWTAWQIVSRDEANAVVRGKRFVQYESTLSFNAGTNTPILSSVTINSAASYSVSLDTQNPTGSIQINNDAANVNTKLVTLKLLPTDPEPGGSGIKDFQLSNDGVTWGTYTNSSGVVQDSGTWKTWNESYRTAYVPGGGNNWYLNGADGTKTVYVKYRDNAENVGGNYNGNWINGLAGTVLEGKSVFYRDINSTDAPSYTNTVRWKTTDTSCVAPQCNNPGSDTVKGSSYSTLSANNAVDFTLYPARRACQIVGGRLPYSQELAAIYGGKVTYGNNFITTAGVAANYLSATENNATNVFNYNMISAFWFPGYNTKTSSNPVRCVSDSTVAIPITDPITLDTTAPIQATNPFVLKATTALENNKIKQGDTYYAYGNAADNDGGTGVATLTANLSSITTGQTAVNMTTAGGPWTVNSVSYAYRSPELTADANLTTGTKSPTLTTTDNATNTYTSSGYTVTADIQAPTITSITSSNLTNTYYKADDSINLAVNFSENITSTGNITVNLNSGGSCTIGALSNVNTGSCTYTVSGGHNANPLNTSSITGSIIDQAGNTLTNFTPSTNLSGSKTLIVDTTAPTFTLSYYQNPELTTPVALAGIKIGTYYAKITASENLNAATSVNIEAEGNNNDVTSATPTLVSGSDYSLTRIIVSDALAVGLVQEEYTVSGTDLAGNATTNYAITNGEKLTDAAQPYFASGLTYSINHPVSNLGPNQVITATFSENMASAPVISINYSGTGSDISNASMVQGANATIWTYNAVIPTNNNGTATVTSIVGTDLAGNELISTTPTTNTFEVDNYAPVASTIESISNNPNNTGNNQRISWSAFSDTGSPQSGFGSYKLQRKQTTPSVGGYIDVTDFTDEGTLFYDISGLPEGSHVFRIISTDLAGNITTGADSGLVLRVDTTAPENGVLTIGAGSAQTKIDTVNLSPSATDNLTGVYRVRFTNYSDPLDQLIDENWSSWQDYTPGMTVPWSLVAGYGTTASDGDKEIFVQFVDNATNKSIFSNHVFYDTATPDSITALTAKNSDTNGNIDPTQQQGWYPYNHVTFTTTATDQGTGIEKYLYCLALESENCEPTDELVPDGEDRFVLNQTFTIEGRYQLKVKALDYVELESSLVTFSFGYDHTTPSAVTGLAASDGNYGDYIRVQWNNMNENGTSPIDHYLIERVRHDDKYQTDLTYSGSWSAGNDYASFTAPGTDVSFDDSATIQKQGQPLIATSVRYVYRIKARDVANASYSNLNSFNANVYGWTRDVVAPAWSDPAVTATACDGVNNCSAGATYKGFEVKITWDSTTASDEGSSISGFRVYRSTDSALPQEEWTLAGTTGYLSNYFYDHTGLNDWTNYYYRVTAIDGAEPPNESEFFTILVPAEGETINDLYPNEATARTPDVTAPTIPASINAAAIGADNTRVTQRMRISWEQSHDYKRNNQETGRGLAGYRLWKKQGAGEYVEVTLVGNPNIEQCNFLDNNTFVDAAVPSCVEKGLPQSTQFTYRVSAVDAVPLESGYAVMTESVMTADNEAPNPVEARVVTKKGDPNIATANNNDPVVGVGHAATISFYGSTADKCQVANNFRCITGYQVYRSISFSAGQEDEEWIDSAQLITTIPKTGNGRDETEEPYSYTDTGLDDETTYYYRVRAIDNTAAGLPYNGPRAAILSPVYQTIGDGWDITPDATKPPVEANELQVKVKDTYPIPGLIYRNVVTWLKPTDAGTRIPDFARYEVYREVLDAEGQPIAAETEMVHAETNIDTNIYTDPISYVTQADLLTAKLRYYVVIVDNANTRVKYPNDQVVNAFANESLRSYALDTITPNQVEPHLVGTVQLVGEPGVSSATITWNTDQATDGVVEFREKYKADGSINDGGYTVIGENTSPVQNPRTESHTVRLFGLKPNTDYDYRIVSKNYLGNPLIASGPALRTGGFNISFNKITPHTVSAEISWTTNQDCSSAFVEFQKDPSAPGDPQSGIAGPTKEQLVDSPRSHTAVLTGLRSDTTYYYLIKSITSDNYVAQYPVRRNENDPIMYSFRTTSFDKEQFTIAPASSNVADRNITATTAQIVWQTATPMTSWVDYGKTSGKYDVSAGDNSLNTTHVVKIDGLVPGTKYYYVVRSKDANDNTFVSQEYSFTAVLKPKISNMQVKNITPYSVTLSWDTNVETETMINWGKTASYGEKKGTQGMSKVHEIKIENLEDNAEYHYQILAKDEMGNEVADEDKFVRTPLDTTGPQILGVKADILPIGADEANATVIVSWQTDKAATTFVQYDEGIMGGRYTKQSIEDKSLNTSHTVIIKDLKPSSSYHFKIVSKDKRGNVGQSPDHTFVTPSKSKSILELILKSLEETFAWTKNMNQFFGNVGKRISGKPIK